MPYTSSCSSCGRSPDHDHPADGARAGSGASRRTGARRSAITLVELLVVVTIIAILTAMLFPAINAARETARAAGCQNNLRQFGMGFSTHAATHRTFCSGAFDWRRDGCVTEVGWVADLLKLGTPPGNMLCTSNPAQISETYNDLLGMDPSADHCVDRLGSPPRTAPDGSTVINPCRTIAALAPGSEARREAVEKQIYAEHYNTNYTPSWFLVRTGVLLDQSGNLRSQSPGCAASLDLPSATVGPLSHTTTDTGSVAAGIIPLLGCGATTGLLSRTVGSVQIGQAAVGTMTRGPVLKTTLEPPSFPSGTPREGGDGWWAVWNNQTLQDYRRFGPVHRGTCNVLFADGSVRGLSDANSDGLLNNGFPQASNAGFTSDTVEVPPEEVFSAWQLKPK